MQDFIKTITVLWPIIIAVSSFIGLIIGWVATKKALKLTNSSQDRTITILNKNIAAQEELAKILANSNANQIEQLTTERKESDARHEKVIGEYRDKLHDIRNQLQVKSDSCSLHMIELTDLRAKTDFKPVMDFQQTWYSESQTIHKQMLETMAIIAPVLSEVIMLLKKWKNEPA